MNPRMKPIAAIGDLVTISGYGARLFRVDSYTHEFLYERGAEYEDIYYDCTCATTAEYELGAQEDITVICKESEADALLAMYDHPEIDEEKTDDLNKLFVEVRIVTKPVEKTKEPTKQERIDALLDERNDVGSTDDFVIVADAEAYKQRRIDEIDAKIKSIQAE